MKSFSDYIIYKKAIIKNLKEYKKINKNTKICAVVKADAYGLGLKNVVTQIDDIVNFYAVACFVEAKRLRALTQKPILILNFTPTKNVDYCIKNNISVSISNLKQLQIICKYLTTKKKTIKAKIEPSLDICKLKIHFAINSGMNRIGFKSETDFYKAVLLAKKYSQFLNIEGIFTHFYNAINDNETDMQNRIFMQFVNILSLHYNLKDIIVHTQNSLSAVKNNIFNYDMVRLGIILYGSLDESVTKKFNLNLKQAISIRSKLINITKVKKGESVSYGNSFVAKRNMIVGTVPLGYADGIFRRFSSKGKVIVNGKFCKVLGTVCMDMFMIDLSKVKAKLFDEVVLIGKDKFNNEITIDNFANFCDTISYEVLTNIKQNRFNLKFV